VISCNDDVSRDTWPISSCTSIPPSYSSVTSGLVISCNALQDMTSPEITKLHEGGIEVQDEIGQASRDTSSLQDITSAEITKVHSNF
jgi:hypothetical protein